MSGKLPKRQICKCPPGLQQICKRSRGAKQEDVEDIIAALQFEAELKKSLKKTKPPKLRTKKWKPPHFKDTCVPMKPSMHMRLRYVGHCDPEPYKRVFEKKPVRSTRVCEKLDFISSEEGSTKKDKKKKSGKNQGSPDIKLQAPIPFVKHTDSDKSIFNIPSPKVSGENIPAQKATVKPVELRPPLPAKSHHELFKPHSGIVINADADYVPDVVLVPGYPRNIPA